MPDPATEDISKAYEPTAVEEKWYARWLDANAFHGNENAPDSQPPYSIVIPPPNVTGVLHLGHVLNNTIQDILARRARQKGQAVLWLPGTDHAGIATQAVVERELKKHEKLTRHDLGREKFLERVWEWKDEKGGTIIKQLKRLGCSCDWSRERFTMDPEYIKWVQHVFVDLFEKGLIYRGKRMVNWCPKTLTAISDEEVIPTPQKSKLYYMRYAVAGEANRFVEIATTRPETLMGDTGVAVNPNDKRYGDLVGKKAVRPFPEAEIPIVADDHIDPEFGTGVLKVTPAHDKADYDIGLRANLEVIDVLHPDGRINCPDCPDLDGLDRFEARDKAVEKLESMGLLDKIEDYENNVGFSERGHVPIEPRLSMQWFLKYPSVKEATNAVANNDIVMRPDRWRKTYLHWMENIQDWCISRQLWWGHRVPVWYQKDKAEDLKNAESLDSSHAADLHVSTDPPADPENWVQDDDVLDTWFSSWLWPFATMTNVGERSDTLKKFYPTTDLVTGPDIIFFWVARMIMAGFEYEKELPFKNVFFTALIRDIQGRKMSKSLGNSPDPLDLIAKYGADGLRFGLMRIAPLGTDVRFDEKQIEEGRNFANKLWNAARYRQMVGRDVPGAPQSGDDPSPAGDLSIYDLDILAKLDDLADNLETAYTNYRFNDVGQHLYEFFWSNYCDWYLEAVKNDFKPEADPNRKATTLAVMDTVLRRFLQHLHPYMPHITEELWEKMSYGASDDFLMLTSAETTPATPTDAPANAREHVDAVYQSARVLRNLKAEYNVAANKNIRFIIPALDSAPWAETELPTLALLTGAKEIATDSSFEADKGTPSALTPIGQVFMPLEGLIDVEAEKKRLNNELAKVEKEFSKAQAKLENPNFVERAKPEAVDKARADLASWTEKRDQLNAMIASLH
ncbi:MAG: valine--tRNA ligase [Verrucomicrobiota bacterium]